jgi:hypothetical protein
MLYSYIRLTCMGIMKDQCVQSLKRNLSLSEIGEIKRTLLFLGGKRLDSSTGHIGLQTIDMNLGHAHCLTLRAPTLYLWLKFNGSRKFVFQGFIWMTKFESQIPTLLQVRNGTTRRKFLSRCSRRFYHSVELILLANCNR